jgi:hypothetical protein
MIRTGITAILAAAVLGFAATEAQAKYCEVRGSDEGLADLRATNISCPDARAVYRKSLRVAARSPEEIDTSFRHERQRWYCAAKNPHREINGQYVDYIWRCVSGERVVRYRWLAGD